MQIHYLVRGQLLFKPTDDISFRLIGDYTRRNESCCGATYYSKYETFDPTGGTANQTLANGATVNTDGAVQYADSNRILGVLNRLGAVRPTTDQRAQPFVRQVAITPGQTFRNITKDYGVSGQLDWSFGDVQLTSITAYRQYKSGNAGDVDYTNVDIFHRAADGNAYRQFHTFTQELRLQGSLFNDRLDWLVGGFYANEKLKVVDNATLGAQYGQFAACRLVATANPNVLLQNQNNPGCLSTLGRAAIGASFGALGPSVLRGLDQLSQIRNVGDNGSIYRQNSENWAVFTHNILNITDTLSLTLGARYTHENKRLRAELNNNNTLCPVQQAQLSPFLSNPAVPAAARQYIAGIVTLSCIGNSSSQITGVPIRDGFKDGEWTGTAVLSWKPTPKLMTYASYAKGYKAGGYNLDRSDLGGLQSGFRPITAADASGLRFDAEKVNAFEVGAKFNTRGFSLNLAAFRQQFKDFQLNTFNGSVFIVQNIQGCKNNLAGADVDNVQGNGSCVGDADRDGVISQGFEAEAAITPIRNVAINAGYTYADTHFRRNLTDGSAGGPLDSALFLLPGSRLSNAPSNVVTTSFTWTPEIGDNGMRGLFYIDQRTSSDYNTGSDLAPEKRQDGFTVVNARIGIRGRNQLWAVEFWGQNIFNKDYIQVAFNSPFQGGGSVANVQRFGGTANALYSAFLAEPRTYGITLRSRF